LTPIHCREPAGEAGAGLWLRQRTTVSRRWISQRLGMGEESGVTRAVRKVKTVQDAKLKRTQQQLLNGVAE
jgi:hypothetical protein